MSESLRDGLPLRRATRLGEQVADLLIASIASGELAPGDRLPPEHKLAEMLGVSIPIVRQAAKALVRRNLITRRQGQGTFVRPDALDWLAGTPRTQGTLGLVVRWTHGDDYFGPVIRHIGQSAREGSWGLQLFHLDDQPLGAVVAEVLAADVDGLVWLEGHPTDPAFEELAVAKPIVIYNRPTASGAAMSVRVDEEAGTELAIRHLLEAGRRRILLVSVPQGQSPGVERVAAARRVIEREGSGASLTVMNVASWVPVAEDADRLLGILARHDAIFFLAGSLLLRFADLAVRAGLRVPDDLAMAVFDDFANLTSWDPPVTAVRQPLGDMSRAAIQMLSDAAHGLSVRQRERVFTPELIVRESTTCRAEAASAPRSGAAFE